MTSAAESTTHTNGVGNGVAQGDTGGDAGVDPRLLEVLVCPVSRSALTYDRDANELVSRAAGLAYPIRNGVPVMLRDEARDIGAPK